MASSDPRIRKRKKELEICQSTVNFFLNEPWEEDYLGIEKRVWFLFLQARFPDENNKWFAFNLFASEEFLNKINQRIESELDQLTELEVELKPDEVLSPSIPPNLSELVEAWKEEKARRKEEKEIRQVLNRKIKEAQKALNAQWEIRKHEELIKNDIEPKIEQLRKEVGQSIEEFSAQHNQLMEIGSWVEKALAEIPTEEISQAAYQEDELKRKNNLKEKVLKPAIVKALEFKGPLTDEEFEEFFGIPIELVNTLQAEADIEEIEELSDEEFFNTFGLPKKAANDQARKWIGEEVAKKIVEDQKIIKNFLSQASLLSLKDFIQRRKEYLEKIVKGEPVKEQSFEDANVWATKEVARFVHQTFEPIKNDLRHNLNLTDEDIDALIFDTAHFICSRTFLSQNPSLFNQPAELFINSVEQIITDAFEYHLRRPAFSRGAAGELPIIGAFVQAYSALRNSIPFLRTEKAKAAKRIVEKTRSHFENPPVELTSTIEAAALANYGLAKRSIESGNPLGRLPFIITQRITILADTLERASPQARKIFNNLRNPVLEMSPAGFALAFQQFLQTIYGVEKGLSLSQQASIEKYVEFLQSFQKINPAGFKLFHWHQKHLVSIGWGKEVVKFLIQNPDYFLRLPFIFGKAWIRNKLKLEWKYTVLPKILDKIINNVPGIGHILGFLYKRDEWGFYEGPIERLKSKVKKIILQKIIRGTGKVIWKSGRLLGKTTVGKALQRWGTKIFSIGLTGGLATLIFAFYPYFKKTLKRIAQVFSFLGLAILNWAATYGPAALAGFGIGTVVGVPLGIKVGAATFSATVSFLGPFAIIPAFFTGGLTVLVCQLVGTGLGVALVNVWHSIQGALSSFSSSAATGISTMVGETTAGIGSAAAPITGLTLGSLTAFTTITLFITASAFVIQPVESEPLAGSRYIKITKAVDIAGRTDPTNIPNSVIGGHLVYNFTVNCQEAGLTDIVITEKTTITGNWGAGTETSLIQRFASLNNVECNHWSGGQCLSYTFTNQPAPITRTIDKMDPGQSWRSPLYGIEHMPAEFRDTLITNTVTVTAIGPDGSEEKQTATLSFSIGNPPLPETAKFANDLLTALISCYGDRVTESTYDGNGHCLNSKGIPGSAISEITHSVGTYKALQCVGFARAVAAGTGHPLDSFSGHAKDYNHDGDGYRWLSSNVINTIQPGDIFILTAGEWGHMGVVTSLLPGNGFILAEAWGMDIEGRPQGHARWKEYGFAFLDDHYSGSYGFLRL